MSTGLAIKEAPTTKRKNVKRNLETTDVLEDQQVNRQLKQEIKGKNYYAMNISADFQELQIENCKTVIGVLMVQMQNMKEAYDTKKLQLEMAQSEFNEVAVVWNDLENKIEKQKKAIEALEHFKDKPTKFKVLRAEVDNRREESQPMRVNWINESVAKLSELNKFLSMDELWQSFKEDQRIVDEANKTKTGFHYLKSVVLKTLYASAARPYSKSTDKRWKKRLAIYNEKIGLFEWLDDHGIPTNPKHMEQFVHG